MFYVEYFCSTVNILNAIFAPDRLKVSWTDKSKQYVLAMYSCVRFSSEHHPKKNYQKFGTWRQNWDLIETIYDFGPDWDLVPNSGPH